jgi:hypothetical protein
VVFRIDVCPVHGYRRHRSGACHAGIKAVDASL